MASTPRRKPKEAQLANKYYAKGDGGAETSYANGGPVLGRSEDWTKKGDGRFKKGDWKANRHDVEPQNTRTDDEGDNRLGAFLSGGDRFTSQNFAEQGDPASMQRTKPDENWSKDHVKPTARQKAVREGDDKSEKPVLPRGGGKRHGVQGG